MIFPNRTVSALKTYYQRDYKKEHVEEIEANGNVSRKPGWTSNEKEAFHKGFMMYGTRVRSRCYFCLYCVHKFWGSCSSSLLCFSARIIISILIDQTFSFFRRLY